MREALRGYAESVPAVGTQLCVPKRRDFSLISTIGCISRATNMTIVYNMLDKQACFNSSSHCKPDGVRLFNTDLAVAPSGILLAAPDDSEPRIELPEHCR